LKQKQEEVEGELKGVEERLRNKENDLAALQKRNQVRGKFLHSRSGSARIRNFAGSGSLTRSYGSGFGSETGLKSYKKSYKKSFKKLAIY
jgi:hypothetical protein